MLDLCKFQDMEMSGKYVIKNPPNSLNPSTHHSEHSTYDEVAFFM